MKNVLIGLLLGAASATSAQAALQTFQFTANISSVQDRNTETMVESGTVEGKIVSRGEKVVGTLTVNTAATPWQTWVGDDYEQIDYGYDRTTLISARFIDSGFVTTTNLGSGYVIVTNGAAGTLDELRIVTSKYNDEPWSMSSFVLYRDDATGAVLNSTAVTTEQIMLLNGGAFNFNVYAKKDTGEFGWTFFHGDITSMTQLSAVPEPGTYAMLLGGLGLIAWRRRKNA